ncbi:MAG TPA: FAD-dependent oxidoreductase [Ktedonobacteraceae bacterium]|nr:FAD-dependent oxidoreductase [Ktedonobacteraceae bacterium]
MSRTSDIVIIGGGVMGASIAYHLAKSGGARVTLLERQALCNGTTGRSGAIVRQHYSNDFTIRMARDSLRVFQHFDELIGGDCGFATTGMLVLGGANDREALIAHVALQQTQGVQTRMITPQEIGEVAPGYNSAGVEAACYEADAGVADPMATTSCFGRRAQELGVTLREGLAATRIVTSDGRIVGVDTRAGVLATDRVIVAANVWSTSLVEPLGITLPILATRHPMVALRRPADFGGRTGLHAVCLDMLRAIYLRPDFGGFTLVGSTEDVFEASDPDHYAQGLSEEEIAHFRTGGGDCLPPLKRAVPRGGWAGIYDDTPDFHPILDRLPGYDGLYCAVGFSGHGFKLSPLVGQWMAEFVLTGQKAADMQPLNFARFTTGQEIRPAYNSGVLA